MVLIAPPWVKSLGGAVLLQGPTGSFHKDSVRGSMATERLCHFSHLFSSGKLFQFFSLIHLPHLLSCYSNVKWPRGKTHWPEARRCKLHTWSAELFCPTRVVPSLTNFKNLSRSPHMPWANLFTNYLLKITVYQPFLKNKLHDIHWYNNITAIISIYWALTMPQTLC